MKQTTLQVYSLKHSMKKGMFSVLGKLNLFKLGRGSDPSSHALGYVPGITQLHLDNSVLNGADVEWRTSI